MADNRKKQAIARLRTRAQEAVANLEESPSVVASGSTTTRSSYDAAVQAGQEASSQAGGPPNQDIQGFAAGLAAAWQSPAAEEVAHDIEAQAATARQQTAQVDQTVQSAYQKEDDEVDDDDDRADPRWDH